jgi:isopentenyl-diphosphate Delta-isomerase
MKTERLILVDKNDRALGEGDKLEVHRTGTLHRAFSIFVFDDSNRLLLQKRAQTKYHSGGLWSNTCCGHPRPSEDTLAAAHRRLLEEMNFDCPLREAFAFLYRAELDNDLVEHEYDHVFFGRYNGSPEPAAEEVEDWKWMELDELKRGLSERPEKFSYWLRAALEKEWQSLAVP